jgi:predicted ester cyclase
MDNKRVVTEYFTALSGKPKSADLVARYVSDAALIEHIAQVEAAFPHYELIADQILADGDLVAVRGTFRGAHSGVPFAGIEPRGIAATGDMMIIYRIENGRIAEHWLQFDIPGLLAQLQPTLAEV